MRRILLAGFLILSTLQLHAQSFSAGLRANAGYRMQSDLNGGEGAITTLSGEHLSLAPEIFLRFEAKKKWAIEASCNQTRNNQTIIGWNAFMWRDTQVSRAKYYDLTLSGQYKIGSVQFRKTGAVKAMHNYLGVSLGMLIVHEELQYASRHYSTENVELNNKSHSFWTGLNHTALFDLGKHFRLVSGAYVKLCPDILFASDEDSFYRNPKVQFGLQVGAAYRIF